MTPLISIGLEPNIVEAIKAEVGHVMKLEQRDSSRDVGVKWVWPKVENCSCHIYAPCSRCFNNVPTVDKAIEVQELGPEDSGFEVYVPYEQLVEAYAEIDKLEKQLSASLLL
jgi:hypothetical protein